MKAIGLFLIYIVVSSLVAASGYPDWVRCLSYLVLAAGMGLILEDNNK